MYSTKEDIMKKADDSIKTEMMTLRCSKDMLDFIELTQAYLNDERPLGVSKITKTDAILTLLNYGVKQFCAAHGDPRKKKAKTA